MVVRFELGGLNAKTYEGKSNIIEARVHRVAEKSRVQVWVRQNAAFIHHKAFSSDNLLEGGELHLRLLSKNAKNETDINDIKTISILKFSDILNVVRKHYEKGVLLTGHPDNNDNSKVLQASVFPPLNAFKSGFQAHAAQLLGLRVVEQQKARGSVESKAQFSSLSGGALATRCGMPIGTARTASFLMSPLSARHLLSRLLRR